MGDRAVSDFSSATIVVVYPAAVVSQVPRPRRAITKKRGIVEDTATITSGKVVADRGSGNLNATSSGIDTTPMPAHIEETDIGSVVLNATIKNEVTSARRRDSATTTAGSRSVTRNSRTTESQRTAIDKNSAPTSDSTVVRHGDLVQRQIGSNTPNRTTVSNINRVSVWIYKGLTAGNRQFLNRDCRCLDIERSAVATSVDDDFVSSRQIRAFYRELFINRDGTLDQRDLVLQRNVEHNDVRFGSAIRGKNLLPEATHGSIDRTGHFERRQQSAVFQFFDRGRLPPKTLCAC